YYAQALFHSLAEVFGTSIGSTGLIITMTQLGYVLGVVLLVALGDLLERRRLITIVTAGSAIGLAGAAMSTGIG
ncbi:MFS transporter, partial [Psychromonas aquatilis]